MKTYILILGILLYALISCKPSQKFVSDNTSTYDAFLDTVVDVEIPVLHQSLSCKLTQQVAKETVLKWFKAKGFCNTEELTNENISTDFIDNICVSFDTLYPVDLNNDNCMDGIVSYWLAPNGSSSHCWQPQKAIIVNTGNNYTIIKEDFLSDNYIIDSITQDNMFTNVHGYDYNCSNHEVIRNFRVRIKK